MSKNRQYAPSDSPILCPINNGITQCRCLLNTSRHHTNLIPARKCLIQDRPCLNFLLFRLPQCPHYLTPLPLLSTHLPILPLLNIPQIRPTSSWLTNTSYRIAHVSTKSNFHVFRLPQRPHYPTPLPLLSTHLPILLLSHIPQIAPTSSQLTNASYRIAHVSTKSNFHLFRLPQRPHYLTPLALLSTHPPFLPLSHIPQIAPTSSWLTNASYRIAHVSMKSKFHLFRLPQRPHYLTPFPLRVLSTHPPSFRSRTFLK